MPARVIRYIVTTLIGLIPGYGMAAGLIASLADSFLTDRVLGKNGARFFIDELKALPQDTAFEQVGR
jgi:hypothetical protein